MNALVSTLPYILINFSFSFSCDKLDDIYHNLSIWSMVWQGLRKGLFDVILSIHHQCGFIAGIISHKDIPIYFWKET